MTDLGLTDLIAAHDGWGYGVSLSPKPYYCIGRVCNQRFATHGEWVAHVASVVEEHTNGRIGELEMLQQVDRDLLAKAVAVANDYKARAKKAEDTIYRVKNALPNIEGINRASSHYDKGWDRGQQILTEHIQSAITGDYTRAALEGEQQ
ncbi:hypothetical protein ACHMZP_21635 [Rhodococcus baikonurensis]|uniref:hypothetical protein n=1 Tax=Rhodococcus baikonurensis TaxID=172041 RepID=UPI0037B0A9EE